MGLGMDHCGTVAEMPLVPWCRDSAEAQERAASLVERVFLRAATVPALNEWTKVDPDVAHTSLLT
eukprot:748701-Prorocentrum_lima.AAC.1